MSEPQRNIDALLSEKRTFPPPQAFRDHAVVGDPAVYETAAADHEAFWAEQAGRLAWSRPWDSVMERDAPWVTWFKGGRLNASVNCLDRHIDAGGGDKVAFLWEGEPADARAITYAELLEEVCRLANALRALGDPQGRPGQHLPRHDPRAPDRDARVRADRRSAFGRVRRLQRRGPSGPDQRRRGQGPDHRRRRLAAWTGRPAEGERGRGGAGVPVDRARDHRAPMRERACVHRGSRPLVPRSRRRAAADVRAGGHGSGRSALPALHERHDRQAQGDRAHDRRLPDPGRRDPPDDLRHPRR